MKILILILLSLIFFSCDDDTDLSGQTPPDTLWIKTFGGSGDDGGSSVQQTTDGGYIIAGSTESYGAGEADFWLVKTDENGNEEWNQIFGGSDRDFGYSVQQTTDGGYIITGSTRSFGNGGSDVWLIKTDSNGEEEWNQTFGGIDDEEACSVQQTLDGGFIIAGTTSYDVGDEADFLLIKTDENGNEEWNQTYGGGGFEGAYSVQQTTDGGYIIAGYTESYGAGSADFWLIKTDENGNEEWNQTYGGGGDDDEWGHSVQQTTDGGYIMTGYTGPYSTCDFWLVKTDENGNEEWNQTYGGNDTEIAFSVQQTTDGGYIIAGYTESYWGGDADFWLVKTDENGNEEWNQTYGGSDSDGGRSVQQTTDGGYIISGATSSFGNGGYDVWLIRLASETTTRDNEIKLNTQTYSNPFTPETNILHSIPQTSKEKK